MTPRFSTVEEIQEKADEYLKSIDEESKPTITGLAYHLGFASRQSFYDYEAKGEFSYALKRMRLYIESIYESNLHKGNPAGSIFALKNFGWKDKQEIDQTISMSEADAESILREAGIDPDDIKTKDS